MHCKINFESRKEEICLDKHKLGFYNPVHELLHRWGALKINHLFLSPKELNSVLRAQHTHANRKKKIHQFHNTCTAFREKHDFLYSVFFYFACFLQLHWVLRNTLINRRHLAISFLFLEFVFCFVFMSFWWCPTEALDVSAVSWTNKLLSCKTLKDLH